MELVKGVEETQGTIDIKHKIKDHGFLIEPNKRSHFSCPSQQRSFVTCQTYHLYLLSLFVWLGLLKGGESREQ